MADLLSKSVREMLARARMDKLLFALLSFILTAQRANEFVTKWPKVVMDDGSRLRSAPLPIAQFRFELKS